METWRNGNIADFFVYPSDYLNVYMYRKMMGKRKRDLFLQKQKKNLQNASPS